MLHDVALIKFNVDNDINIKLFIGLSDSCFEFLF